MPRRYISILTHVAGTIRKMGQQEGVYSFSTNLNLKTPTATRRVNPCVVATTYYLYSMALLDTHAYSIPRCQPELTFKTLSDCSHKNLFHGFAF
jgi:hypothetical protein